MYTFSFHYSTNVREYTRVKFINLLFVDMKVFSIGFLLFLSLAFMTYSVGFSVNEPVKPSGTVYILAAASNSRMYNYGLVTHAWVICSLVCFSVNIRINVHLVYQLISVNNL